MTKTFVIGFSFLPFLYFAGKDNFLHFRARKVSVWEHIVHLVLGIALAFFFRAALRSELFKNLWIIAVLAIAGSLDEFLFHRNLPAEETEMHAKEHWALFLFLAVSLFLQGI
ncbi:MAG: hypothetical protein U1F57_10955 [bacterium]